MDAGKVTALTLLDLSTAFDTIDNTMLLWRLDNWFEVTGKALDWFESYLTGRCRRIKLGVCLSSKVDLTVGIPQGSVLVLCFSPSIPLHWVAWSVDKLSFTVCMLMTDSCVSSASGDSAVALNGLQSCSSIQSGMLTNKPKLNSDKTEFLLIGNEWHQNKCLSMFPIELFGVKTNPAKSARNLGVIFDQNFTFHSCHDLVMVYFDDLG